MQKLAALETRLMLSWLEKGTLSLCLNREMGDFLPRRNTNTSSLKAYKWVKNFEGS